MRRELGAERDSQVLSGPSESSLDFVDDEKDAIVIADLAKALEEALGSGDVTSLAENGLDDEGGGVTGSSLLLEKKLELL